jgi:hypothetical protein
MKRTDILRGPGLAEYQGIEDFARRSCGMSAFWPEIEMWRIAR